MFDEQEQNRLFTRHMKQESWERAPPVPGRDPTRWRLDAVGNIVCHELRGCLGCLCHEYDHIIPYSKGGGTTIDNCQVLQTRANRYKGNEDDDKHRLRGYSCNKKWSKGELDAVEMGLYGDVRDELGKSKCRCKSNFEVLKEFAQVAKLPKRLINDTTPNCP